MIQLAGCVIVDGSSMLLLHRIAKDHYELPGGKVKEGESPEDAAKREMKEELLCDVDIGKKLGETTFEENGRHFSYVWFLAKVGTTDPEIGEPDVFDHLKFIPFAELENYNLSSNMKRFAKQMKEFTTALQ